MSGGTAPDTGTPPRWQIVLGVEVVALLIALVIPVMPRRVGSNGTLADLIIDAPSYLETVGVYLVLNNLLIGLFIGALLLYLRAKKRRGSAC